jgi:hypothetical protein
MNSYEGDRRRRNANYGEGIYRRRLALHGSRRRVEAQLEDGPHGFRLRLCHDGHVVTALESQALRFPFNTCPGAIDALQPLLGTPLDVDAAALRRIIDPGNNCTHLHDLATLALAHARRSRSSRVYDIEVPDERDGQTTVRVALNGVTVHDWRVRDQHVVGPDAVAGGPLLAGFYRWAISRFSGDQLEAATIAQRGYFVAQARRYDFASAAGAPASDDQMPQGACYSYNHGVVEHALRTGTVRDFSNCPELLLKFQ